MNICDRAREVEKGTRGGYRWQEEGEVAPWQVNYGGGEGLDLSLIHDSLIFIRPDRYGIVNRYPWFS